MQAAPHDTDKIKILLLIAVDYGSNNPEKELEYSNKAVEIAENSKYKVIISNEKLIPTDDHPNFQNRYQIYLQDKLIRFVRSFVQLLL